MSDTEEKNIVQVYVCHYIRPPIGSVLKSGCPEVHVKSIPRHTLDDISFWLVTVGTGSVEIELTAACVYFGLGPWPGRQCMHESVSEIAGMAGFVNTESVMLCSGNLHVHVTCLMRNFVRLISNRFRNALDCTSHYVYMFQQLSSALCMVSDPVLPWPNSYLRHACKHRLWKDQDAATQHSQYTSSGLHYWQSTTLYQFEI